MTRTRSHRYDRSQRVADRRAEVAGRRQARAVELVEAAMRAIRRNGPGVSMDQIAAEAGVAKPILYRHFGDRGGLVLAVARQFTDELRAHLSTALKTPNADPRAVLRRAIDAHVGLVEREPDVYRFVVERVGAEAPDGSAQLQTFLQQVGAEVAVVLGEALDAAGNDSGVAEPWAFGIVGMVHSASVWWVERRSMSRRRLVDSLTSLIWSGIGPAVTPPGSTLPPLLDDSLLESGERS